MDEFLKRLERLLTDYECDSRELKSDLDKLILGSAKRVRPRLANLVVLAEGEILSDSQEKLIVAGELLHTASLIHDDIIDDAEFRRGNLVLHKTRDAKLAVIAGDLLAASAMNKVLEIGNIEIIAMFQKTFEKMCNAEVCQYYARGTILGLSEYMEKTKNKTALLFATILCSVAILSQNMSKDDLFSFGLAYGTAFQIRNDLNSYKDNNSNDKENGVYTAPDIFFKEFGNGVLAIEKTELLIDNEKSLAKGYLEKLSPSVYKDELISMIEGL